MRPVAYGEAEAPFDDNAVGAVLDAARVVAAAWPTDAMAAAYPCDRKAIGDEACALAFSRSFGKRAWRRPLTDDEATRALPLYRVSAQAETSHTAGLRAVAQALLSSPYFLYRTELGDAAPGGRLTSYEMASALSYFLTASAPDDALVAAAEAGQLADSAALEREARRLLGTPRARTAIASFLTSWLRLAPAGALVKSAAVYPRFTPILATAMRQELDQFAAWAIFDEGGTLDTLLTAPVTFADKKLAAYYGVPAPGAMDGNPARLDVSAQHRAGVLTNGFVLATHAKAEESDPIRRGKLVLEGLLCAELTPPPATLNVQPPPPDPNLTTRERLTRATSGSPCNACHDAMNAVGFGFEEFDGAGLYRTSDNGRPVDTSGRLSRAGDADGAFTGVAELGRKLAGSEVARRCFAHQVVRYAVGRDPGACADETERRFQQGDRDVRALLVSLATSDLFGKRQR